jgi:hypothetical protein
MRYYFDSFEKDWVIEGEAQDLREVTESFGLPASATGEQVGGGALRVLAAHGLDLEVQVHN